MGAPPPTKKPGDMRKIVCYILALALMGCIADGPNDSGGICRGKFDINIHYRFEEQGESLDELGVMNVYVFDARSGALVDIIPISSEDIAAGIFEADLLPGEYTFVAWGSSAGDLEAGGYNILDGNIDDFRLDIDSPDNFDELFYAKTENVVITDKESVTVPLDFMCYTNLLRVEVAGADFLTRAGKGDINVYVTGKMGRYLSDGSICPEAPAHIWPSTNPATNNLRSTFDVHVIRLHKEFHLENPLMLHVERDSKPLFDPQDIVRLLLKTPDYNEQEDFDKKHVHNIVVGIDPVTLQVTITINGYTIVYPTPGDVIVIKPQE